jgi:hypothetical protein
MADLIFAQGQTATLAAQFVTTVGQPVDVPDAEVAIFGPSLSVVLPATAMTNVTTGFYFYDYLIPNSLEPFTYTVRYTGTVLGTPSAITQTLQVVEAGTPLTMTQRLADLVAAIGTYIDCAQAIPVLNELGTRNEDATVFKFSWPRWNLTNAELRINGIIHTSGFALDFDAGKATFTSPRLVTDRVTITYNFRMFSDIELLRFLSDALDQVKLEPPADPNMTLESMPSRFVGVVLLGASALAYAKFVMCLQFPQYQTIFGGREGAKDAISNFMLLKENKEKQFERDKKTLKTKGPYPKMYIVSTPEYTLPGGRCLSPLTMCAFKINGKEMKITIKEAASAFKDGAAIEVVSQPEGSEEIGFAPVSMIWESGDKEAWVLETERSHRVVASAEHLFFSTGSYVPLGGLEVGDDLVSCEGGVAVKDRVKSVKNSGKRMTMYDLEVPSTGNLFANGVKCHNSRWFRYLFSSQIG